MACNLSDLCEDNFDSKLHECVKKLTQNEIHLVAIVEELGPHLTDIVVGKRKLGLLFLARILTLISRESLNEDECRFLGHFFRDRMQDHHTLMPDVISGIEALFYMDHFRGDEMVSLLKSSFNEIHAQSHILADRSKIFSYHHFLLNNKLSEITPLGMDYLLGYIQAVDEEKDPNNLMLIFNSWPIILSNFELEPLTEDAFDTLACYFPIDFTPPSGVYGTVTKEKLILALRHCLSDTPAFAPKAIPLFLEKLDSDLTDAKIDSAQSLAACLASCSPEHAGLFLEPIWNALRMEIMGVRLITDEQVVKACLDVLKCVTYRLATVVQTPENRNLLTKWLEKIWSDCGRHLKDLKLKFMTSSVDIFSSVVASKTDFPAIFVLDRAIPILLELYQSKKSDVSSCVSILGFVSKLLKDSPKPVTSPEWYENFLFVCNFALTTENEPALEGAACLALTSGIQFVSTEHAEQIFVSQMAKVCEGRKPVPQTVQLFAALMSKCPRPSDLDLDQLFEKLPSHPDSVLPLLKVFCKNTDHLDKFFPRILGVLSSDNSKHLSEICWAIQLSREIWHCHKNLQHFIGPSPNLFELAIDRVLSAQSRSDELESSFRDLSSNIASHLTEAHASMIETLTRALLNRESSFEVLETFLCSLKSDLLSRLSPDLVSSLFSNQRTDLTFNELPIFKIRAAFINKLANPDAYIQSKLNFETLTKSSAMETGWILQSTLLRNHPMLSVISKSVLLHLRSSEEQVSETMARQFVRAVSNKNSDFLDQNSALSGLARQKLFMITKPDLVKAYNEGINPSCHLNCVICQLEFLPKFALASEIQSLVPLLAKGLHSKGDDQLVIATLTSLRDIFNQDATSFGSILSIFLPVWIELATDQTRIMNIRIEALKCVKVSSKTDAQEVEKLKREVLRQLIPALGDHKRLVRREAVAARNAWALASS